MTRRKKKIPPIRDIHRGDTVRLASFVAEEISPTKVVGILYKMERRPHRLLIGRSASSTVFGTGRGLYSRIRFYGMVVFFCDAILLIILYI